MTRIQALLFFIFLIAVCNIHKKDSAFVDARFFEYELPNRTITICPSYSLISLECPQVPSTSDHLLWQANLPKYLISVDYIRSFPLRLGFDPRSCQPDLSHACNNYDLRYINTLCNGKPYCSDLSAYQIRERSLCAFKAVTEIGFHCVPTWNLQEIQTKYDICKNSSLTNDYGFIYSRNYPSTTSRISCFTTIYTRPNYRIILYYVNGELNHDQLRIESVTSNGVPVVNVTLDGNLTTQRLAASIYEIKITFLPSQTYSYHPTYYLLYFYTVPICTFTEPCPPELPLYTTTPFVFATTSRSRVQSVGWTRVQNIWIVIPIILAYILLLLLIVVLALLLQRRRKQKKLLEDIGKTTLSSRYLDGSGASSRTQLVTPLSPPPPHFLRPTANDIYSSHRRLNASYHPSLNSSFAQNPNRYHRESRSDVDLHQSSLDGIDYRHHASIPHRIRPTTLNDTFRGYGTMDYPGNHFEGNRLRRSLPKSFSDCDLCKRRIVDEEHQRYSKEQDDNWRLENSTIDRRVEPRAYQDKINEHFHERVTANQYPDDEHLPSSPPTTVEYSTVLPRHQRLSNEATGPVHHLPFEYVPNEVSSNIHPNEFQRNSKQELNRRLYDSRESQEMSMRMNDRHQYYHQ